MIKESYERLHMDVTRFDMEDVITTSEVQLKPEPWEQIGPVPTGSMPSDF